MRVLDLRHVILEDMQETDKLAAISEWLGTGSINIFGLPYSGKDTHGSYLAEVCNASLLGGGEILRNSHIPPHVKEAMDNGELVPTDDYVRIVLPYLSSEEFAGRPMILSSVGRWHGEESGVLSAAAESGHPVKAVIYLHISIKAANERFNASQAIDDRGERADDTKEKLITRFSEFEEKTLPVIEYYRTAGLLLDIDGNPPKSEVRQKIIDELYRLATS